MKKFFWHYIFNQLRAIIVLFILLLNAVIVPPLVIITVPLTWLLPTKKLRLKAFKAIHFLPWTWRAINNAALHLSFMKRLHVQVNGEIDSKKWYVLMSNHQSWSDILIMDMVMNSISPTPRDRKSVV